MDRLDLVEVRQSNIEGLGLFARTEIPAGTKIGYFTGVEMSYRDFKSKYGNDWRFVYQQRPYWLPQIVAKDKRNLVTYVNDGHHGDMAPGYHNCILSKRWLVTFEDIEQDEELLLQYPKNYNFDL